MLTKSVCSGKTDIVYHNLQWCTNPSPNPNPNPNPSPNINPNPNPNPNSNPNPNPNPLMNSNLFCTPVNASQSALKNE